MPDKELRPIGSEFCVDCPPSMTSTDPNAYRYWYTVVAHVLVPRYTGDEAGDPGEEVRCVRVERIEEAEHA